jgi:hypothetical protein
LTNQIIGSWAAEMALQELPRKTPNPEKKGQQPTAVVL